MFESGRLRAAVPLQDALSIGRGECCAIRVSSPKASRAHCTIGFVQGLATLHDSGSTNGTYRFGQRLRQATLNMGDEVVVGDAIVKLVDLAHPGWSTHEDLYGWLYEDGATRLLNRRGFDLHVDAWVPALPAGTRAAIYCVQLSCASSNDAGHRERLVACADALRRLLPAQAFLARTGEREFSIFHHGFGQRDAQALGSAVFSGLRTLLAGSGCEPVLGAALLTLPVGTSATLRCAAMDSVYLAAGSQNRYFIAQI